MLIRLLLRCVGSFSEGDDQEKSGEEEQVLGTPGRLGDQPGVWLKGFKIKYGWVSADKVCVWNWLEDVVFAFSESLEVLVVNYGTIKLEVSTGMEAKLWRWVGADWSLASLRRLELKLGLKGAVVDLGMLNSSPLPEVLVVEDLSIFDAGNPSLSR